MLQKIQKQNLEKEINKLFYTVGILIYETDMQHGDGRNYWPFHPVLLNAVVAPFVFEEFYRLLKKLEKRGYSLEKIAEIIKSPTRISSYQLLWPSTTLKQVHVEKKKYLAEIFVQLLKILRNGEVYCENSRNPVWDDRELEKFIQENKKYLVEKKKNLTAAKVLAKLEGLLMSYCEILYFYKLDLSRLFHGLYQYQDKIVFIKEFLDLKAGQMWNLAEELPFNHFQEVGFYPKQMQIQVFFTGHTHAIPSFPQAIESFILKLDGKPITNLAEIKKYYQRTEKVVNKCLKYINTKMNDEEFLLKRGINLFFYPLKPLYKETGEDWREILPRVYKFAQENKSRIKIPPPWGSWDAYKATKHLFKTIYKNVYGKSAGKWELEFIKKTEEAARAIRRKEALLPKSYSLIKALNEV